jgi:hypothetical protein
MHIGDQSVMCLYHVSWMRHTPLAANKPQQVAGALHLTLLKTWLVTHWLHMD